MSFSPPLINPTNRLPESEYSTTRDQPFRSRWFRFHEDAAVISPFAFSRRDLAIACQRVGKPQLCYGATASRSQQLFIPSDWAAIFFPDFPRAASDCPMNAT
jgi:hypothetical protein